MKSYLFSSFAAILALTVSLSTVSNAGGDENMTKKDIVETAVAAGTFNTLAAALTEAGLIETLKGKGPFTVFAPSDKAFAKIPKSTLDDLLKDKEALKRVLLYHVVSGKVMSGDLVKMNSLKTIEGNNATLSLTIDGANIVSADIGATNGVIHVIDSVIMPPAKSKKGH